MQHLGRAEEDKIYQLRASLNLDYEDLRSHVMMNVELPSFKMVCTTVPREEARRRVMNLEKNSKISESRPYKGKNPHLKCSYCDVVGRVEEKCWILHPELKPKFNKDHIMIPSRQFHTG